MELSIFSYFTFTAISMVMLKWYKFKMVNEKQKHQYMQPLLKSHWLKIPKVHQSAFLLKSEKIALDEYNRFSAWALVF